MRQKPVTKKVDLEVYNPVLHVFNDSRVSDEAFGRIVFPRHYLVKSIL